MHHDEKRGFPPEIIAGKRNQATDALLARIPEHYFGSCSRLAFKSSEWPKSARRPAPITLGKMREVAQGESA
jgi:hypothetical protein